MIRPSILPILLAAALAACQDAPADAHWTGRTDTLADTITVTTVSGTISGRPPIVIDSVAVLWGADSLSRPRGIARVAGVLAVAERDRVYVISPEGEFLRTLGRPGDGPGEFRWITGVGASDDTLYVFDGLHFRLSAYARADSLVETWNLLAGRWVNVEDGPVRVRDGMMTAPSTPNMGLDRPAPTAVLRFPLDGGPADSIAAIMGPTYLMTPTATVAPKLLFGADPRVALGSRGEIAWTDGVSYCVSVLREGAQGVQRICRDWTPVPVTDGVRDPDLDALVSDLHRQLLTGGLSTSEPGEHRNSIDVIFWDHAGRLWVRTVDSLQADLHPYLLLWYPELRPAHYQWDVFDTSGRLYAHIALPSTFSPQAFVGDTIYGFYELETGEQTVGRVVVWDRQEQVDGGDHPVVLLTRVPEFDASRCARTAETFLRSWPIDFRDVWWGMARNE